MTTYARIVGGCAVDVVTVDPATLFHADVAEQFVTVPDDTQHGDVLNADGSWTKHVPAVPAEPVAPPPPTITPPQFKLLMLPDLAEIMEAAKTDVTMATFLDVVNDPRLTEVDLSLQSVQNGIQYCLAKIGRTADQIGARMTQILTGKWS